MSLNTSFTELVYDKPIPKKIKLKIVSTVPKENLVEEKTPTVKELSLEDLTAEELDYLVIESPLDKQKEVQISLEEQVTKWLDLFQHGDNSERDELAVNLQDYFSSKCMTFYQKKTETVQDELRCDFILAVKLDHDNSVRHILSQLIMEMVVNVEFGEIKSEWTEYLNFLFICANARNPRLMVTALGLYLSKPSLYEEDKEQANTTGYITLANSIRTLSVYLAYKFMDTTVPPNVHNMLVTALQDIAVSVERQDDLYLLKLLLDFAKEFPEFCIPYLENIFKKCLNILSNMLMDDCSRQIALQIMTTLSEFESIETRNITIKYIEQVVINILKLLTNVQDDIQHPELDRSIEEQSKSNDKVAAWCLDRLMFQFAWQVKPLPAASITIKSMLTNSDWKVRYGGLTGLAILLDGINEQTAIPDYLLKSLTSLTIKNIAHEHHSVRYAAAYTFGRMPDVKWMNHSFRKEFETRIGFSLLKLLIDEKPEVQACALDSFCIWNRYCTSFVSNVYLIIEKLLDLLYQKHKTLDDKNNVFVLNGTISVIDCYFHELPKRSFLHYYNKIIPYFKYIIKNAKSEELTLLRCKTIKCASRLVSSVVSENIKDDAYEIMNVMLEAFKNDASLVPEANLTHLLFACNAFQTTLDNHFEQYLPFVMGLVLRTAEVDVNDTFATTPYREFREWHTITLSESEIHKQSKLDYKDTVMAIRMMQFYSQEFPKIFAENYIEEAFNLTIPKLSSSNSNVRKIAVETFPYYLECAKVRSYEYQIDKTSTILPILINSVRKETDVKIIDALLFEALNKCIQINSTRIP